LTDLIPEPGTSGRFASSGRHSRKISVHGPGCGRGAVLGSFGSGLLRFDPQTAQFEIFGHRQRHGHTVSNDHVNAVFIDHTGRIWAGTQDGLDVLDPKTGQTRTFSEKHGLPSNAVACILEDSAGRLWMSTTNGLSRLDPRTREFRNFSSPDGLPGTDLTGYSACYQTSNGEMYFGGYAGAVRFSPQSLGEDTYEPPVVLTRLDLNGTPIGSGHTIQEAVTHLQRLSLRYDQNNLSFEFAALSYAHSGSNRYRYMLEGLEPGWRNADATAAAPATRSCRPAHTYSAFRGDEQGPLESARRRDLSHHRATVVGELVVSRRRDRCRADAHCSSHLYRVRAIRRQFEVRLEERVGERTRIARELHDSLLQGFQGLLYRLQPCATQSRSIHLSSSQRWMRLWKKETTPSSRRAKRSRI